MGEPKIEAKDIKEIKSSKGKPVLYANGDPVGFIHQHMSRVESDE
jgi:hypothetical protein